MTQIKAEEEAEVNKIEKKIEDERIKKLESAEKAKEEEPLVTEYIPVDFASADDIKGHITLTARGTISIDTRTNTIILRDIASSIEDAKNTVKQFDTPVKQIMIEARIVDASTTFSRDLGVQWNQINGERRNSEGTFLPADVTTFAGGGRIAGGTFTTNTPSNWSSNLNLSFGRLTSTGLGAIGLDASLALAETDGTAKVISAPKVIAREGTSATISSGDSIIIAATENVASTTLDATLSLTVTPTSVSYNDFITMDVAVTDDQAPSTSRLLRKAINTTLMIKSGETVVIGGIIKESEGADVNSIPGLGDIPGLGWLFKAKSKTQSKSELMIFLTPTVLPSPVKSY
jgi:type IV pilus assembly protein PilQ